MKIGLIDVDGHSGFPNLALMKIAAYHKSRGDEVVWWNGFETYDKVYMSKVFNFTPDIEQVIYADEIAKGGTGYGDYSILPEEIEKIFPDYSMYPKFQSSIGFLTRGCIRNCPWCIVPKKEGYIKPASSWKEIARKDVKTLTFMDNNVLASDWGISQIEELGRTDYKIDFNQGMDARLVTPAIASLLAKCKWQKYMRFSCDTNAMIPVIKDLVKMFEPVGVKPNRILVYTLIQDVDESYKRIMEMQELGVDIFAQPFRDFTASYEPRQEQKDLARWVNMKAAFNSCTFAEYLKQVRGYTK